MKITSERFDLSRKHLDIAIRDYMLKIGIINEEDDAYAYSANNGDHEFDQENYPKLCVRIVYAQPKDDFQYFKFFKEQEEVKE